MVASPDQETLFQLVDEVLQLTEDRQLEEAERFYAPGAVLEFPGAITYNSLQELAAGARSRYRFVRKHREDYILGRNGDADVVVCIGKLYGEDLNGTPFDNVRFIDVFQFRDGKITHQLVWNDLSALGIVPGQKSPSQSVNEDSTTPEKDRA